MIQQIPLRSRFLGQTMAPITVIVSDANGKAVKGAEVQMIGQRGKGEVLSRITDSDGKASFPYSSGDQEIHALYDGLTISKSVPEDSLIGRNTVFISFPVSIPGPVLKTVDLVILGSAAALTFAGIHYKVEPLKVAGEILFGAAAFTVIYRLS